MIKDAKYYAPGIKRKEYPGNIEKLKPGMLVDYFVQRHDAYRRGTHYDFRLGDKNTQLFSWALNQNPLNLRETEKIPAARTNLHQHSYGSWSGLIPRGSYGAGPVKAIDQGKALITRTTDKTVSFSIGEGKYPERFTLINPGDKYGKNHWLVLKQRTPESLDLEKQHYKTVEKSNIEEELKKISPDTVVQPKIDGALQYVTFGRNKIEMLSHRLSDVHGKPVYHTERVFGVRPHKDIPKHLRGAVLMAEVYGTKNGQPIPQQQTSALLNSSLYKSLTDQEKNNIKLKAMLFGVAKYNDEKVKFDLPYDKRKEILIDALKLLPKDQFHLPEEAKGAKAALELWHKIKQDKHTHTNEGVVIHPPVGVPTKVKLMPEQDVYIRSFFPGEGKYTNKGVGGFYYSHTPKGEIAGKVGTGFDDSLRILMFKNPKQFIGRKARVHSQGELPSGALRAPALINIHEG